MKRRSFLKFLGLAPAVPVLAKLPATPQVLESSAAVEGFGLATAKVEGTTVAYDHVTYGLGYKITHGDHAKVLRPEVEKWWGEEYNKQKV